MEQTGHFSFDFVKDHPCFGCKYAKLLPKRLWGLTERLECVNEGGRKRAAIESAIADLERSIEVGVETESGDRACRCALNAVRTIEDMAQYKALNGFNRCAPWFECGRCKEYDEEAEKRLLADWKAALAENTETTPQADVLKIMAKVRHWEDAEVNGKHESHDNPKMPFVGCRKKFWVPEIDLERGRIVRWPKGVVAKVNYKVYNGFYFELNGREFEGRVPAWMSIDDEPDGSSIRVTIDEEGNVKGWNATEIKRWLEEDFNNENQLPKA